MASCAPTKRIPILITAVGGGGFGEQILKALLQSDRSRYKIIGADVKETCPQFSMVDEHVRLPLATASDYLDNLLDVCLKNRVRALFPGCEPELKAISDARIMFEKHDVFLPINSKETIDLCMDKSRTALFLEQAGFAHPRFVTVENEADISRVDFFPAVVKPAVGGGGSANCYIVQSQHELVGLSQFLGLGTRSQHFMVQEYVGTPESEFTVGVLHDMAGRFVNSIALRRDLAGQLNVRVRMRNLTKRIDLGEFLVISSGVSQGHVGNYREVTEQSEKIARDLGVRGAVNIQCRMVDNKIYVFEINPRFSGTTSIRAMMGYNEPDVLLRSHFFGELPSVRFNYREGTVVRSLKENEIL